MLIARVAGLLGNLVLVPVTINRLGPERYGVWMAILSALALMSLTDLGIGNAMVSRVASAEARGDDQQFSRDVSTAVALYVSLAFIVGLVFMAGYSAVPWHELFNLDDRSQLQEEARFAVVILLAIFIARAPLDLVYHIRQGKQEGYINAIFDLTLTVARVGCVSIAVRIDPSLPTVVAAASLPNLLASLANWTLLVHKCPEARPRIRLVDRTHVACLIKGGGLFVALQLAVLVGYTSDNFVAAQILGPTAVTHYAIPSQLALAAIGMIGMLTLPLWPAYADASARGDLSWVTSTLYRSIKIVGAVAATASAGLLVLGRPFIRRWSGGVVTPGWLLLGGLAAWIMLATFGNAVGSLLNALHVVKVQVVAATIMAGTNIVLSIHLAQRIGVAGLIWGTVISYTLFVVIPYSVIVPRLLRRGRRPGATLG